MLNKIHSDAESSTVVARRFLDDKPRHSVISQCDRVGASSQKQTAFPKIRRQAFSSFPKQGSCHLIQQYESFDRHDCSHAICSTSTRNRIRPSPILLSPGICCSCSLTSRSSSRNIPTIQWWHLVTHLLGYTTVPFACII